MGIPRTSRKLKDNMSLCVQRHQDERLKKPATKTLGSLPRDLLVDVLGRLAKSSFTDLFNAKLSCKDFLESTTDDYIYEHISIDKFPIIHWLSPSPRVSSFLTHCFNKGNSESLFRKGMIAYFNLGNVESGVEYLKSAMEKGHSEATYVYGMILLSRATDDESSEGLNLLNSMNFSKSRCWNLQECRHKVKLTLAQIWINNPVNLQQLNTKCREGDHAIRFAKRGWSLDEDKEISSCDTCLWYRELIFFCKIMNVIV
ncbi:hypothetical protein QVD17_21369 [Tagetes erecta]|uniref:At2g35280-like TPR domain-containing protein n=1 Tax=Tagetes erecta TaxID=13708 RepID=A0AAD8NTH2_TARER|nr:hypothetical protein QVD17_21369 [Tagetes erecta]